ncbi:hypothetical protein V491_00608 [Pseudogymnoascus sp. VKM F-3775]|nr:hypothetical protein V491_00608 [Pseudogymnoascus sp. VKM F-3775]
MTESNIRAGFNAAGLVPLSPDIVISKLDMKLQTLTPSRPPIQESLPWASRTPNNPIEATSQSEFIKSQIAKHQNSSPISIYDAIDQFSKGAHGIIHWMALLQAEVTELREANTIISKRRRAKKTHVQLGGSLNIQDAGDLQDQRDVAQQVQQEMHGNRGSLGYCQPRQQRCGIYGKPGHNARTCQVEIESSGQEYSE